ncbi:ATP-binding protein [Sphingomonas immobilis]|uniref:histidine kinase n=1 Tax=Sphingomonas immobilis TaxID=3063997 RepID=A0ABT8ZT61_9SPHN|nr:ATP-binding protein [Sphingomonas sp. CA1-15]MDO7840746.1 ATP-binding protein [Sphingomonas sp. CA1-15]
MDRPLLALTRRTVADATVASENMRQLVQLRWLAVGGQLVTILGVAFGLGVALPLVPMLGVVALLVLANLAVIAALPRHAIVNGEIMLALLLDMAALTVQLYLSGGASNPFISFYLLQVVLGAILLERWSAWVLVAVASLCYAGLTMWRVPLAYPPLLLPDIVMLYTLGGWISFALTGILLAQFITRITRNLRARDRHLADLRHRAAEEDGIVRMGLFASGAAHELGTPLASLSVILGDWRRMPQLAGDPELAGELEDMRAEVERCKTIVSDILHSAGEPRGEAMERARVRAFVDDVVGEWAPTHSGVAVDYACEIPAEAAFVTGPSLRQAIWNLLDNAAEASPGGIALRATRTGEGVVLAVSDEGAGFLPEQLPAIGKPYASSKGAGHGVGLFLASNVARRLGGRLEAANRAEGGAEVRLILPLAPDSTGKP